MASLVKVVDHVLKVYKTWYTYRDGIPKKSRYTLGDKIDARFLQLIELLQLATYQSPTEKIGTLGRALTTLDMLKFMLRVAWEVRVFDEKKYATLSEGIDEAGKQIGGWKKGIESNKTSGR